jgi:hypothetical protein
VNSSKAQSYLAASPSRAQKKTAQSKLSGFIG